jgi:hypothetical protein
MNIFIVSSHFREDLNWLINQSDYDYIIYSKNTEANSILNLNNDKLRIIENRGMEATSYLNYIIDFYENLPEFVAFCHGHENAWHQYDTLLNMIKKYNFKDDYFTLNNPYYRNCLYENCPQEISYPEEKRAWNQIKSVKDELLLEMPSKIEITMGAQFIVTKQSILRNKKSFYENLNNWLNTQKVLEDNIAGMMVEQLWYLIFTGKEVEPRLIPVTIMSERGYIE